MAITVGNPPANQAPTVQIAADPISGGAPLDVRFTASGRDPEGGALMYTWDYGDGAQGAGRSVTHRYLTAGTYTAKVTVRDAGGATGTATVQVTVGPAAQGGVRGAQAELAVPSSVRAFRARGLKVTLSCETSGSGRASLKVTAKAAKRLKLRSRTVAARRLSCTAGRELSLRLKPTPADGAAAGEGEGEDAAADAQRVREGGGGAPAQGDDPIGARWATRSSGSRAVDALSSVHGAVLASDRRRETGWAAITPGHLRQPDPWRPPAA